MFAEATAADEEKGSDTLRFSMEHFLLASGPTAVLFIARVVLSSILFFLIRID